VRIKQYVWLACLGVMLPVCGIHFYRWQFWAIILPVWWLEMLRVEGLVKEIVDLRREKEHLNRIIEDLETTGPPPWWKVMR